MAKRLCLSIICSIFAVSIFHGSLLHAKEKGLKIIGYVWATQMVPAAGKQVRLLDKLTGKLIDADDTNFLGKYVFKNVEPGEYIVQVDKFTREVAVLKKNVRVHFNLFTKDGTVDYEGASKQTNVNSIGTESAGPTDPALASWIAGEYYSYQGSTERKLMFCPSGVFYDSRESSYSGTNYDSLGNETYGFGSASAVTGSGRFAIQGTRQSGTITFSYKGKGAQKVNYSAIDKGCLSIMNITFCYKGPPRCQ